MELALQILLVATSILVVLLVLLHRAKGGGLSTLYGGGVQSSLFRTDPGCVRNPRSAATYRELWGG